MASMDEQILRTAKEVIVKFIETGRISPTSFHESFKSIYDTVAEAVYGPSDPPAEGTAEKDGQENGTG